MKRIVIRPVVIALLASVLASPGAVSADPPEIKSATYKITKVYRYDIQVVRIAGQFLTVDIEDYGRRRFHVPRDFTFEIENEKRTLNQLRTGMRLHAYVTEVDTGELMLVQDEASTDGVIGESVED